MRHSVYNVHMTSTQLQEMDEEVIANEIIKLFKYRIENPRLSLAKACDELGMPYQRTLQWINQGKMSDYLATIHDIRSDISQIMALDQLPAIVEYQAKIATGQVSPRGSNPTAAAAFVLEVARLGSKDDGPNNLSQNINIWIPNMKKDEAPVIDASSEIIDLP